MGDRPIAARPYATSLPKTNGHWCAGREEVEEEFRMVERGQWGEIGWVSEISDF